MNRQLKPWLFGLLLGALALTLILALPLMMDGVMRRSFSRAEAAAQTETRSTPEPAPQEEEAEETAQTPAGQLPPAASPDAGTAEPTQQEVEVPESGQPVNGLPVPTFPPGPRDPALPGGLVGIEDAGSRMTLLYSAPGTGPEQAVDINAHARGLLDHLTGQSFTGHWTDWAASFNISRHRDGQMIRAGYEPALSEELLMDPDSGLYSIYVLTFWGDDAPGSGLALDSFERSELPFGSTVEKSAALNMAAFSQAAFLVKELRDKGEEDTARLLEQTAAQPEAPARNMLETLRTAGLPMTPVSYDLVKLAYLVPSNNSLPRYEVRLQLKVEDSAKRQYNLEFTVGPEGESRLEHLHWMDAEALLRRY